MDIKELANRYKKEIPEGLDDERFLKSVYIKLGKERVFDEKYFFGNSATMKKIYMLAERNKHNREFKTDKRDIVCYSLSYIIKHLLKEFGYNCIVTPAFETGDHVFPIVTLNDGRKIKFDLQRDLENIQTYCKTQYFATVEQDDICYHLDTIEEDAQIKIDMDIQYIKNEDDYKDITIQQLEKRLKENPDLTIWQKVNLILSDERLNDISQDAGYVECFKFYNRRILPKFFNNREIANKVHVVTCSKTNQNVVDGQEYTNCIYVDDRSAPKAVFMFSRVYNKYILTPFENVIKIQEEGLVIGTNRPSNGATKLKKELKEFQKLQQVESR